MFAVPGWSVKPSALVQAPRARVKDNSTNVSKKRKRELQPVDVVRHAPPLRNPVKRKRKDVASTLVPLSDEKKAQPNHLPGQQIGGLTPKPADARSKSEDRGRKKIKKNNVSRRKDDNHDVTKAPSDRDGEEKNNSTHTSPASIHLTALQAKMRSKLTSARFRHLNETLYTTSSTEALAMFTTSPMLFADYHAGFSQQVREAWPQNPVDNYIQIVKARGDLSAAAKGVLPLPRRKTGSCTIADLGCGDAPLARGCQANIKSLQLRFHNYDLHAPNTSVVKADVSNLPLRDGEIDIAVFCLSLMGTNWITFVEEAWRILRGDGKGEVWVAEVKSRFGRVTKGRVVENSVGKRKKAPKRKMAHEEDGADVPTHFAEEETVAGVVTDDVTDVSHFIKVFTGRGFQLREGSVNKNNKMFVSMVFTKSGIPTVGKYKGLKWNGKEYLKQQEAKPRFAGGRVGDDEPTPEEEAKVLKPCVYKTR